MVLTLDPRDGLILIVDDEPDNVRLLHAILKAKGYRVSGLTQPASFFEVVEKLQPDLILLDVKMPPFSGFELCRQLKEKAEYVDLPVVFLTAMADEDSLVEGFSVGGVDYITKPFSTPELFARVKNHIMQRLQYKRLVALNQEKNSILMVASHDLRNPFASIQMAAQLLTSGRFSEKDYPTMLGTIQRASQRGLELIENLLNVHRIEAGFSEPSWEDVDLHQLLPQMQLLYQQSAQRKDIQLHFQGLDQQAVVRSDSKLLLQVLDNLLSNAIKYTPLGSRVSVTLESESDASEVVVRICDQGPGFTAEDQDLLYQKFAKLSARPTAKENSNGLGLAIVKELCDKLNIEIQLKTSTQGSCFSLRF